MKEKQICLICLWQYIFCSTKRNYVLTCEGKTLWFPLIKVRKKNCYKAAPPRGVRTGNNSTQTCWCTRFWKHHAVFPENWPEPFTEGLDSIRNVCVLCQAMPYGWRQREHFVGPAVLWTIARPLRHIVPPRRSMQSPRAKKLAWNLNKKNNLNWGRALTADKIRFIFPSCFWLHVTNQKASLGSQLWARPTIPCFAFLCRRSCRGPEGKSWFEDGHRRAVSNGDGVNSLHNHLYILLHRASLAETFDSFQERDAVSCQNSRRPQTALSNL